MISGMNISKTLREKLRHAAREMERAGKDSAQVNGDTELVLVRTNSDEHKKRAGKVQYLASFKFGATEFELFSG